MWRSIPPFFYESLWNLIGLLLILFVVSRARRFDGENTWFYFLWYGLGRFWIEGLRTDSLYLFDWTFMGEPIRVSQALSLLLVLTAAVMLFWNIRIRKHAPSELLVNRWRPGGGGRRGRQRGAGRRRDGGARRGRGAGARQRGGDKGGDRRWQCALTERPWPPR